MDKAARSLQSYLVKKSLVKIRHLNLKSEPQMGRPSHISAASGLVMDASHFYVVADDELSLGVFARDGTLGELIPLFSGTLPLEPKTRKKSKPDLEALVQIEGGLLAVPSGSTESRVKGAFIKAGQVTPLDFSPLYDRLGRELFELNIEGAVSLRDHLLLFQRGNGARHINAMVFLDLESVKKSLQTRTPVQASSFQHLRTVDLGTLTGVPLSFTDACVTAGEIWFLAAAELSDSTYLDGEYLGSVLGKISTEGVLSSIRELDCPQKPEGLVVDEKMRTFWIVTDADDADEPASLYQGQLD